MLEVGFFISLLLISIFANKFGSKIQRGVDRVQNIRKKHEARVGGILIFTFVCVLGIQKQHHEMLLVCLFFIPALIPAVVEDFFHRHDVGPRVIGSGLSAILISAFFIIGSEQSLIFELGLGHIILLLALTGFCFFSIHSFNLIDGMDGLASGYFCLSVLFLINIMPAPLAEETAGIGLSLLLITTTFFCFNFLFSRVLLGDMGAYFLGYLFFVMLMILAANIDFELLLVALFVVFFPFYEVIRTIVRRICARVKITDPDRLHLHSILFEGWINAGVSVTVSNKLTTIALLALFGGHLAILYEFRNVNFAPFAVTGSAILMYEGMYYLIRNFIKSSKDI